MRMADHVVAPEELMALLDGELGTEEARDLSAHVEGCAECGEIARQFRAVSESIARWTVEDAAAGLDETVLVSGVCQSKSDSGGANPGGYVDLNLWKWNPWAIRGGVAIAAALIVLAVGLSFWSVSKPVHKSRMLTYLAAPQPSALPMHSAVSASRRSRGTQADSLSSPGSTENFYNVGGGGGAPLQADALSPIKGQRAENGGGGGGGDRTGAPPAAAPMIARTVALTIVVKDVPAARAELERLLAHYQGYAAQLTVNTLEGGSRSFQASLRVPAPELATALAELRALGHVENESQAGEEVTQQHADLVARLQNSRETEQRLKDILTQRTGKIEDVLQVEEEIARVRGEIEGMEADQKTLEHRVDFASVDLQMSEVFKAQLGTPSASVGNQMRNAFVSGLRGAGASLLGVVLFVEEAGPAILVWVVLLGGPGWLLWRRYRRMRARI
jgi:hypothetical protein